MELKFKKGSGTIPCRRNGQIFPYETDGWKSSVDNLDFLFHRAPFTPKIWHATETETGAYVTAGKTRKECAEWVVNNIEKIKEQKEKVKDEIKKMIEEDC